MHFFLFKGRTTVKPPSLPLPCTPVEMSHLLLFKAHARWKLPSKNPAQEGGNSKAHTYIPQSSLFSVVLLSLGSSYNTVVNMEKRKLALGQ